MTTSATNLQPEWERKLQLGLERLNKAGDDSEILGNALVSLHGSLEDFLRAWLSTNPMLSEEERSRVQERRQVQWRELVDLMQQYASLSDSARRSILRANSLRQEVAHGDRFSGTRTDVESYATFIQQLIASTTSPNSTSAPVRPYSEVGNQSETVFYSVKDTQVTNTRLIVEAKTYAIARIRSVAMSIKKPNRIRPVWIALLIGIMGPFVLRSVIPITILGIPTFIIAPVVGLGIAVWLKPRYSVVIGLGRGQEMDVLASKDRNFIEQVVNAINHAIINRRPTDNYAYVAHEEDATFQTVQPEQTGLAKDVAVGLIVAMAKPFLIPLIGLCLMVIVVNVYLGHADAASPYIFVLIVIALAFYAATHPKK
ncbi:MAG: DUF6232 family protein [Chloroflexota bacterium]|nr:DUF6232 family protein [Chloroflexota bacterium]